MIPLRNALARVGLLLVLVALLLFLSAHANAAFRSSELDRVASVFANRPVVVQCRSVEEDYILLDAWGYVWKPTGGQTETFVRDEACVGALAIDLDVPEVTDYMKAIGVAVVVHESFHLRRVQGNENEAVTECRAMQNYDKALLELGAEPATIARLMPLLIAQHWRLRARVPTYNRPSCLPPRRYDKWLGFPPRD